MRNKRLLSLLLAAVVVSNSVAPNLVTLASEFGTEITSENGSESETEAETYSKVFQTLTNRIRMGRDAEQSGNIYGYYSINNNNQGVDDKITQELFEGLIEELSPISSYDTLCTDTPDRALGGLSSEQSYLIDNGFIARPNVLSVSPTEGIKSTIKDLNNAGEQIRNSSDMMNKTELLTALYKICFGTIWSRPILWKYKPFRLSSDGLVPVSAIDNYQPTVGDPINAVFKNDYYAYYSSNVYELYLIGALDKGIIQTSDLSKKKSSIVSDYTAIQNTGAQPKYSNSLGPVIVDSSSSGNYLGKSFEINDTTGRKVSVGASIKNTVTLDTGDTKILDSRTPSYFNEESIKVIDAYRLVEKFLRMSEKDMSSMEASIVSYKYGAKLANLSEEDQSTVSFLIAKGIVDFEDESEYTSVYDNFTYEKAYSLLYRVANSDARVNFSEVQLTDGESFWQQKGYTADDVYIYQEGAVPEIRVLDENVSFEDITDVMQDTTDYTVDENTGETEWLDETEAEQTEPISEEQVTSGLLQILCTDAETDSIIPGITIGVFDATGMEIASDVTDENGYAIFDLPYGNYYFMETEAPASYTVNSSQNAVTISEENRTPSYKLLNNKSGNGVLKVHTMESGTQMNLSGVTLGIYDETGTQIGVITTTEEESTEAILSYGNYSIRVEDVPDGYKIPDSVQTIRLSDQALEAYLTFSIDLQETISTELMTDLATGLTAFLPIQAFADVPMYTVKMLLEKSDSCSYTYDDVEITEEVTAGAHQDIAEDITVKQYNDVEMYCVTFKVKADTRDDAMSQINTKLHVNTKAGYNVASGVTKIESDDGVKTTLVSAETIRTDLDNIKIINNSTLMNTRTGVTALFMPDQGYALVGNKIVTGDDLLVEDNTGEIYYNLKAICSLMSNAELRDINGSTALVSYALKNERLFNVISENETTLEKNYLAKFSGVVETQANEEGTKTTTPWMYNLDAMTRGLSALTRTFSLPVRTENGKNSTNQVTVIVKWDFLVPASSDVVGEISSAIGSDTVLDYDKAAEIISTPPENSELLEWWQYNLGMSNALANFMYGTNGVQYVACGYLVPSVTVLSNSGGQRSEGVQPGENGDITLTGGSLSDDQLNELFRSMKFSSTYSGMYLNGTASNWWNKYYSGQYANDTIKKLISQSSFECYGGNRIQAEEGENLVKDGYVFGNAKYLVLKNGTVYANASNNKDFNLNTTNKTLQVATESVGDTISPFPGVTEVTVGSENAAVKFKYLTTEKIGNQTYFKMIPTVNFAGNVMQFKCNVKSPSASNLDELSDFKNEVKKPAYYVNDNGQTLFDYEKALYGLFGLDELPFGDHVYSKRFELNTSSSRLKENRLYADFYSSGGTSVRFYRQVNGIKKEISVKDFQTINKSESVYVDAYVYLPTNDFYFTKSADGTVKVKHGFDVGVLNGKIYYTGLNNILRDQIIADSTDTVSVNKLDSGDQVYIGNLLFTKMKDGSLVSGPIRDKDSILSNTLIAIDAGDKSAIKSSLLKSFGVQTINVGGRAVSLQSFIDDIGIGPMLETDKTKVLFRSGNSYYYYDSEDNPKVPYKKESSPNLHYYMLSIKVDKALLCRPLDADENLYQMLYVSDSYASGGLGGVPFYFEYVGSDRDQSVLASWRRTAYDVNQFFHEFKDEFLNEYQQAFQGDLISFLKMIAITLMSWWIIVSLLVIPILKYKIGISIFQAIANPTRDRFRSGIDLVKIFSLGMYDIDDDPSVPKVLIMTLVFFVIMYILVEVL